MTHNVTSGYKRAGQNAPKLILTSEMNSVSQFTFSFIYRMIFLFWIRLNLNKNIFIFIFS